MNCNSGKLSKIVSVGLLKNHEQEKCNIREIKNSRKTVGQGTFLNYFDYTSACNSFENREFLES